MNCKGVISIVLLLLFVIMLVKVLKYVCCVKCEKEGYSRVFPPLNMPYYIKYFKTVTPLRPLISPLKRFDVLVMPSYYVYNYKYMCPVRDQGNCGACYAFVICSMLSDIATLKLGKFGRNLNVEQLISCYPDKNKCAGEAPEDVMLWLQQEQFKLSISNEYNLGSSRCLISSDGITVKKNSVFSLTTFIKAESVLGMSSSILEENIKRMKSQLISRGPFISSLTIYEDLFSFAGDSVYIKKSDKIAGGHAVLITGFCDKGIDTRKGYEDGYWVCKNSWGVNWAYKSDVPGYFYIRMGTNECGIESRAGCSTPNIDYILPNKEIPNYLYLTNINAYISGLKPRNSMRIF